MSEIIFLSNVRLSFPKLVEAAQQPQFPNSPKKYSADLILTPDSNDYKLFMQEVGNIATAKWKDQAGAILQMIQGDRRLRCYGTGAEKLDKNTMRPYVGYEGMLYITTSADEEHAPVIIRENGSEIANSNTLERQTAARKLYGGCYVNAAVRPWAQDNQFGRAVRCQLIAVQFSKNGDAFGEAPPDLAGKFGAIPQEQGAPAPSGMPSWMPQV